MLSRPEHPNFDCQLYFLWLVDWRFLFLLIFSTSIDFWTGLVPGSRKVEDKRESNTGSFPLGCCDPFARTGHHRDPPSRSWPKPGGCTRNPNDAFVIAGIPSFLALVAVAYRTLTALADEERRRACMIVSIVTQLTVLGFFKYFDFFADSLVEGLAGLGSICRGTISISSCPSAYPSTPSNQ